MFSIEQGRLRFNQGVHQLLHGGLKSEQGADPLWPPHFIHWLGPSFIDADAERVGRVLTVSTRLTLVLTPYRKHIYVIMPPPLQLAQR